MNRGALAASWEIRRTGAMTERWLPVVGFEGIYEVSDCGNVRSLDRFIANPLPNGVIRRQFISGRPLKPGRQKIGDYPYVNLSRGNKAQRSRHVHRLVMDAFVGRQPEGMQVRHLDGDPTNNNLSNLAYGTRSENSLDMVRHGRHRLASQTHCKRGHELIEENLISGGYTSSGRPKRDCKICARVRYHESKSKRAS